MLLNFKKFYRKPYLEKSNFGFQDIISRVLENYKSDIEAKNLEIDCHIPQTTLEIYADKILIEEVIVNLFVNAIYFSPENGKVMIEAKIENGDFLFFISDEGDGVSEEIIENIFNPFFSTKSSGSGLGLAISKNIIEAHNGLIEVENMLPKGAKFTINIPIKE